MPFVSEQQRRFAYATHQPWADRWERETPKGKKLPRRVKRKGKRTSKRGKRKATRK